MKKRVRHIEEVIMQTQYFKKLFLLLSFLFVFTSLYAREIVIYHTSDIHGYYFSRSVKEAAVQGGFAVLETLLQRESNPFILLDSGDFSSGNKEANDSDGKYSIDLMNRAGTSKHNFKGAGYAALTIGNHDSDFGDERLGRTLSAFNGDVLSVNLEGFTIPGKNVKPFAVYVLDGVKVAVIGFSLEGPGMRGMKLRQMTEKDWTAIMQEVLAENPAVIVLLAHDSVGDPRKPSVLLPTLRNMPLLRDHTDLFLGGHAHILHNAYPLGEDGPLFVESGSMLEGVSRILLDIDDKTNTLRSIKAEYIPLLEKEIPPDPDTKAILDQIEDVSLRQPFAFVPALLPRYPGPGESAAPLARIIAEEMYQWVSEREKIDFALFQLPGIRRDLQPGILTGRDLVELLPYNEYVSTFDITGKHLKRAIAESIRRDDRGDYSLFSYSENVRFSYKYNPKNTKNPVKIKSLRINGKKVKNSRIYRVAAISHIPQGFFEGPPFKVTNGRQKMYEEKTSGGLLLDAVGDLPGDSPQERHLTAPQGVQIQLLD